MKYLAPLILLLAACGTTRITAVGGKVDLGNDVSPGEEHTAGGLEVSSGPKGGGFGFEVGARYGKDTGAELGSSLVSESYEEYAGPRYEWRIGRWSPFVSGGLSQMRLVNRPSGGPSRDDDDLGLYVAAGTDYHFGSGWHLGVSLRKTIDHNLTIAGQEADIDSWQYLLRFGYAF